MRIDRIADAQPSPVSPEQTRAWLAAMEPQLQRRVQRYGWDRAVTAYERSMEYKRPPIYGVSLYKLAWCDYNAQDYKAALGKFKEVIKQSEGDKGEKDAIQLKNEALIGTMILIQFIGMAGAWLFAWALRLLPEGWWSPRRLAVGRFSAQRPTSPPDSEHATTADPAGRASR